LPDVSLPINQLDARHPSLTEGLLEAWDSIDLLASGGHQIKAAASRFLWKREKELSEVYQARLSAFTYQDILGTATGWYEAAMFADDPDIFIKPDTEEFYVAFLENCDRARTSLAHLFRKVFLDLMRFGCSWILTDLPRPDGAPVTLAEQRAAGALDPYLVLYDPRQVINWDTDQHGNITWVVAAASTEQRGFAAEPVVVDRWYYFDRNEYRVYEARREKRDEKATTATLVDSGRHALSRVGRVPLRRLCVPSELWIGNRALLPAVAHLNLQNAHNWGLHRSCLPVLYVKGDFEHPPSISEVSYLHISEKGEIGYVEPSGSTYQVAADEIGRLREETYRQMYLQAQGRSTEATPAAQSGVSKELDMAPARDILNGFGDILLAGMRQVLEDVAAARGDNLTFDLRGFTFDDQNVDTEIRSAQHALDLAIPSETLEREIQKRAARCLLKDARPELVEKVEAEIDGALTRRETQIEDEERQAGRFRESLGQGVNE